MRKLNNTDTELTKSVAYRKSEYTIWLKQSLLKVKKAINFKFKLIEEKRIDELDKLTQEKFSFYCRKSSVCCFNY